MEQLGLLPSGDNFDITLYQNSQYQNCMVISKMSLIAEQCRAGRALLGWSQDDLVNASKVTKSTIANFEAGKRTPYDRTLADVRAALEKAGCIFIDENGEGPGVRLRKAKWNRNDQSHPLTRRPLRK
jgi:transcriptional regulator with XRE-family HTH domain